MKVLVPLKELKRVLPTRRIRELAVQHKTDARNQVRLPGAAVFVCLLDAVLNHGVVTQRLLEEIYEQRTGVHADHSSFGERLRRIPARVLRGALPGPAHAAGTAGECGGAESVAGALGRRNDRLALLEAALLGDLLRDT
jgi:hypothetical protein